MRAIAGGFGHTILLMSKFTLLGKPALGSAAAFFFFCALCA